MLEESGRRQHPGTRCEELDRERKAVHGTADLAGGANVLLVPDDPRPHRVDPLDEEGLRIRERRDRVLVLPLKA